MKNNDYGPCYACSAPTCSGCPYELMNDWVTVFNHLPDEGPERDHFIENLWRENENIIWQEDAKGRLCLAQPFHGFPVSDFTQDDWFEFIDAFHSKGVGWVYENID